MILKANGDLLLSCCPSNVPVVGNIHRNSLYEILTSSEFIEMEKAFDNLIMDRVPAICANCAAMHVYNPEVLSKRNHASSILGEDDDIFRLKSNTIYEFEKQVIGKKLVVFGGGFGYDEVKETIIKDKTVCYIIDNDEKKHGVIHDGVPISPVDTLKNEDVNDIVVLITFNRRLSQAIEQLKQYGVQNYFFSTLFLDYATFD